MTYNDSELIAVWISDQMSKGLTQAEALERSISEIDGVFTYLISNTESMGFAKDRWAIKPLVAVEEAGEMAVATEEQAVRTVYPGDHVVDNYDGPSMTNTWPIAALKEAA
jgi:glutamine phosphoribosylpyrophosphate amidotransferase